MRKLDLAAAQEKHPVMKRFPTSCTTIALAALVSAVIVIPSFAQDEATKPAVPATQQSPDKLPADQPKVTAPVVATSPVALPSGQSEAEMMKQMMEMSKLNDNHKLLGNLAGTWTNVVKMWMNPDPSAPPTQSTGTVTRKAIMGGRYFVGDFTGKVEMPG